MIDDLKIADLPSTSWWESDLASQAPTCAEDTDAVPTTAQARKKRLSEEAEDYPNVVARLNSDWRIILCRDGIQWILQRRTGGRWRAESYCRARDALLRCIREKTASAIDLEAIAVVNALPERI